MLNWKLSDAAMHFPASEWPLTGVFFFFQEAVSNTYRRGPATCSISTMEKMNLSYNDRTVNLLPSGTKLWQFRRVFTCRLERILDVLYQTTNGETMRPICPDWHIITRRKVAWYGDSVITRIQTPPNLRCPDQRAVSPESPSVNKNRSHILPCPPQPISRWQCHEM